MTAGGGDINRMRAIASRELAGPIGSVDVPDLCRLRHAGLAVLLLALAACGSSRFAGPSGRPVGGPVQPSRVATAPPLDAEPYPGSSATPTVIASPLPPAPGTSVAGTDPSFGDLPTSELATGGQPPASGNVATLGSPSAVQTLGSPPPAAPAANATRSSTTGNWTARDGAGGSCKVLLSSQPALELSKASSAGCANKDLQTVNAWDLRDGEVYLYSRGGVVVARLRDSGGSFNGALVKSGAPLTLSR